MTKAVFHLLKNRQQERVSAPHFPLQAFITGRPAALRPGRMPLSARRPYAMRVSCLYEMNTCGL
jgi:hypothetical protein